MLISGHNLLVNHFAWLTKRYKEGSLSAAFFVAVRLASLLALLANTLSLTTLNP